MPPEWWREYRRRRCEELRAYNRERRQTPKVREQRRASEARRRAKQAVLAQEPLPMLYPHLQRGTAVSFWEDELRLDLEQEAALARLEGRCPVEAVRKYRAREAAWSRITGPLIYDQPEGSGGEGSMAG